ncbi:MAG: nucleotidyltransferase domain-containing protein [Chloroflexi bacterium]|nr:nucleotidyltransferase domain-containing protein [Chloroflexota bacterium]
MKKPLSAEIKTTLKELKQELIELYGKQLKGVYLFGSYARGDFNADSDVDVLIVLSNFEKYGAELRRTSETIGNLSLKHNATVSVIFTRESEWRMDKLPLLLNIRSESIAI